MGSVGSGDRAVSGGGAGGGGRWGGGVGVGMWWRKAFKAAGVWGFFSDMSVILCSVYQRQREYPPCHRNHFFY